MENASRHHQTSPKPNSLTTGQPFSEENEEIDGSEDPAVWAAFTENFRLVQSVLDRNRVLIQQVNENHQSKMHKNLVKNVAFIQEINTNVSKVVSLYSNLSADFSNVFNLQNVTVDGKSYSEDKQ